MGICCNVHGDQTSAVSQLLVSVWVRLNVSVGMTAKDKVRIWINVSGNRPCSSTGSAIRDALCSPNMSEQMTIRSSTGPSQKMAPPPPPMALLA